jgi:phosphatidylserine/phosphatidylglycerophosphate/cardiolipin synthase-like enzyme
MRLPLVLAATLLLSVPLASAEVLCDSAFQDCRAKLLAYINAEKIGIDIGFNLWEEPESTRPLLSAVIARHRAGVRVRVIAEPRRNKTNPLNLAVIDQLKAAGIPIRYKAGGGIFHWKMFHFAGQQVAEFAATNFAPDYLRPRVAYLDAYVDPLYFSTDLAIVHSLATRFEDMWIDMVNFTNVANVTTPVRVYPVWPIHSTLSFVPLQNFLTRSRPYYDNETTQIDTVMYKITESGHADAVIRAAKRGVLVRLITEPIHYRSTANLWHAYHIDRMFAAGVKIRERAHKGFLHQKTTLLYSQAFTIFGSSNWATESNSGQWEHNYFTTKPWFFTWMRQVFNRRWSNSTGNVETRAFTPLPPAAPVYVGPANTVSGQPTTIVLSWKPGMWAHRADVYFGTTSTPPLYQAGVAVSPGAVSVKKFTIAGLAAGRTYYWRVVSKTMAGKSTSGPTWSFGT